MEKTIGIVVLNYNTYDETVKCVNSIREHTTVGYRIYIVDNASTDGSGDALFNKYRDCTDVVVLQNKKNFGYSAGNNVGIKKAEKDGYEYIAIVNSDVELLNDAFFIMIDTLKMYPDVLMIGPSVLDNNGKESQIPRKKLTFKVFLLDRHPFCDILHRENEQDRYYKIPTSGVSIFFGSVSGCCFIIKSSDFRLINRFDENVFLYSEEDILAYKMEDLQRKAAVNVDAKVWHKANISTNKKGNAFVHFHRWTSVLYLLKQYAHISKFKQILIVLWNTITWDLLSLVSKDYRNMNSDFRKRNWTIIKSE